MAPQDSRDFLEASDSEDDQVHVDDSDNDLQKGSGRAPKRQRLDEVSDDDLVDQDEVQQPLSQGESTKKDTLEDGGKTKPAKTKPDLRTALPDATRSVLRKNLVATDSAVKKSGVVYLSRIPPFMKPAKLRSLLEPYGTINRIFLAPEDPTAHARRVRAGGNKKKSYTEGWVEFVKKTDAKTACELLNARIIGGRKGGYYHDDIWNLLYLKGFKWRDLTEQISGENAERGSRMKAEISKTTRENKEFARNVERAKMLDGMQASRAKKRKGDAAEGDATDVAKVASLGDRARTFKQLPLAKRQRETEEQPERVTRVLSKIF